MEDECCGAKNSFRQNNRCFASPLMSYATLHRRSSEKTCRNAAKTPFANALQISVKTITLAPQRGI
jgi:hypothetical protein